MTNCAFCVNEQGVAYTCPKCHAPYCSLKCYQSPQHVDCSEKFYKKEVETELLARISEDKKNTSKVREDKLKVIEALKRLEDEQNDLEEEEDDLDLHERMAGIDLEDTEAVWAKLSKDEREDFQRMIDSGKINDLVPEFVPFWNKVPRAKKSLIQEVDFKQPEFIKHCPKIDRDIQKLGNVDVKRHIPGLFNVLYAYCYAVRLFLGDHEDEENVMNFAEVMVNLSDDLVQFDLDQLISDCQVGVEKVIFHLNNPELSEIAEDKERYDLVKDDLKKVISGPSDEQSGYYILAALSDLKRCLVKGLKELRKYSDVSDSMNNNLNDWKVNPSDSKFDPKRPISIEPFHLKLAAKKVSLYLSLVTEANHVLHVFRLNK